MYWQYLGICVLFILAVQALQVMPRAMLVTMHNSWPTGSQGHSMAHSMDGVKPLVRVTAGLNNDLNAVWKHMNGKRVFPIFRRLLRGPSARSGKGGYIYMFRNLNHGGEPDDQACWKIGCTAARVGVRKRLRQWAKSCGHSPKLIGEWRVTRYSFCENLIHAELKAQGKWLGKVRCGCKTSMHCEWFRGSLHEMQDVISFWVDYVNRFY
ncbi:uncharacterized protein EV422DRAFT_503569 [Fimicolochytrium jonesii]|uniref:uncharacterized protein n=1 Tax=Fimicolochytrium jonesii TaxID=1396493 RepID=UPI0022FF073E|nr:uncharacterized protein EV422DRAFT_503569 [Fimicolochytrium jonesii]KAI8826287.1 hypothetical protein EV422DRAFT_503569 [Fimicolochytrium jonesii]